MRAELNAVTKTKQKYVIAKTTLEQRLREDLMRQLDSIQSQLDVSIRYAYNAGANKAEILRALGTKDYRTLYDSLARTEHVVAIEGVDPLDVMYQFNEIDSTLFVNYTGHGPMNITGTAEFTAKQVEDGSVWYFAITPLWNEDYTVRNDIVSALDGRQDGFYYDEALDWVSSKL